MKRFYYLGDSKDFPSYPHDKNRHISLVSGFSLNDFLNKNKLAPFDLLILCGINNDHVLEAWLDLLDLEIFLPPVLLLSNQVEKHKLLMKKYSSLGLVLDRSIPVGRLWETLEESAKPGILEKEGSGKEEVLRHSGTYGLVGVSPALSGVRQKILKYAVHRLPVLILGESGTGKELIARALHREGHGLNTPFEAFQVSPVGEELFESNLFGVRKGAYTGSESRKGLIEQARGGVLFLDEIGTLSKGNQISLLRFLEERAMRPLGSDQIIKTDFRLISATNEILPSLVDSGQFRRDLYHRISTLVINVPPLRERKEDIVPLAESFLVNERAKKSLTKHAGQKLCSHDWPGNVRELLNAVKRAVVESGARNTIEARDIIII